MREKIIIDGDWGGDEMQLASVLLAHHERIEILGATCVYGNTNQEQVVRNCLDLLSLLKAHHIPVYPGASAPRGDNLKPGDNAHGADGVGGVVIPPSSRQAETTGAVDFMLDVLGEYPAGTVTISATGPLTNLAMAAERDFATLSRVKNILVMGGCTTPLPAADRPTRQGNITPEAEFNFYMAAGDARFVMASGLPITLLPMNCTQQLSFTPSHERLLGQILADQPGIADTLARLIAAPADLDRLKFNAAPFMHDIHTALCLLYPGQYAGRRGYVDVAIGGPAQGRSAFTPSKDGNVVVMETIADADALFAIFAGSVQKIYGASEIPPAPYDGVSGS